MYLNTYLINNYMKLSYFKELVTQQDPTLGAHRDTEL